MLRKSERVKVRELINDQGSGNTEYGNVEKNEGQTNDLVGFFNETGTTIPTHGLCFITELKIYDDSNGDDDVAVGVVKSWSQIYDDDSLKKAIKFPLVNSFDPVDDEQIGDSYNRDGVIKVRCSSAVSMGDEVGPLETTDSFEVGTSSSEKIFVVVGNTDTDDDFCLVRLLPATTAQPLTVFVGSVTSLGDFPQGRSGAGATTTLYSTQHGVITGKGKKIEGKYETTANNNNR